MNEKIKKFEDWAMKIQYEFLEDKLFQPIGLEMTSVSLFFETDENYSLKNLKETNLEKYDYPLAYYNTVNDSVNIYLDHPVFDEFKTDSEKYTLLMFLLYHEASHRILFHISRGENKDRSLFNIASDMEIHNMLYIYRELANDKNLSVCSSSIRNSLNIIGESLFVKKNRKFLFEKEYLQNTAEEIYYDMLKNAEVETQTYSLTGSSKPDDKDGENGESTNGKIIIEKTTYKTKGKQEFSVTNVTIEGNENRSGQDEEAAKAKENGTMTRNALMKSNFNDMINGKDKGDIPSECRAFLKKLFHVKIDWKKILRNSLQTVLEKSELYSWARPRLSMFGMANGPYLPSQVDDDGAYGTLIVARDESGSMTDEDIEIAASIIIDAKEYYRNIIILKHDVDISSVKEFDEINDDIKKYLLTRDNHGGTSHEAVFKWIADYDKKNRDDSKISCCIFLTDLESDIETTQDIINQSIPRIYLVPSNSSLRKKDIIGKIIKIEN